MKEVVLRPVGVVHTDATSEVIKSRVPGVESVVEVFPEFEPALEGLETHSHIFVLGYFHELRPEQIGPLKVKPRALLRFGVKPDDLPTVGVFSPTPPLAPTQSDWRWSPSSRGRGTSSTSPGWTSSTARRCWTSSRTRTATAWTTTGSPSGLRGF